MATYIVRRLALAILIMFGASVLSFYLLTLAPGNAAEAILSTERADDPMRDEIDRFMEKHGLNGPVISRVSQWFNMVCCGNLGVSLRTGEPVMAEFRARFPATVALASAAMVLAILTALPLGIISAVKRNSMVDHAARIVALWGVSMPNFWLGLLLILFFGVILGWFPTYGYGSLKHLVLPALTLGTGMAAVLMRLQRTGMLEALHERYIRTARAKGLNEGTVILRHALPNTLIPVVTIIGLQFAHLLSGVVIVEQVFAWPGVGHFLIDSIYAKDYPVIQGFVLIIAFFFVFFNLAVDVLYAWIDPRIRYERAW